ncbi:MAG: right-handed parallel beta-helix repeat-containing protein [Candidatus Rokubacteria bacterium]|nr:right-handed parallel beta-helix repeat-containing protein [Candidatus Rokubacteria bacterium]
MAYTRGMVVGWGRAMLALAAVLLGLVMIGATGTAHAIDIGPGTNLCDALNTLGPGDDLVLEPGDYEGPCTIRRGGLPGRPVVIRARDPRQRPRILYEGRAQNVLHIRADHVILRGLRFGPTQRNIDAIRIIHGDHVIIEDCEFSEVGGIAVVANHTSLRGLTVRRNAVLHSGATGMYFGCHDGMGCVMSDLTVERNYIRHVRAPEQEIGYGIQVKLNSAAIVRDNVVVDTKGPGIMVYGARDPAAVSVVERNFTMGSQHSAGIVVGGGPARVRNNVSVGNREAGIMIENYGRRGLLRGVVVAYNTVAGNGAGGITAPDNGIGDVAIAGNAVQARPGTPAWPGPAPGLRLAGNVECGPACFVSPETRDFSPAPGSILVGAAAGAAEPLAPADDFFGAPRGHPATAGAVEGRRGPVPLGIKP